MIGRPKVPLVLTTPEQQALDSLAHRARTAPQVARRARHCLGVCAWSGQPNRGQEAACLSPRWWAAGAPAL